MKDVPVLGRCDYQYAHEPVLVGWNRLPGTSGMPTANSGRYGIITGRRSRSCIDHETTRPYRIPYQNSSTVNALVLDPFGGSGSTLIACEQIDRICYTAELDEKFADVIVKRYVDFKGNSDDVFLLRDDEKIPYNEVAATLAEQ